MQSESIGLGKLEEVRFQRRFKRCVCLLYDLIWKFDVIVDTNICFVCVDLFIDTVTVTVSELHLCLTPVTSRPPAATADSGKNVANNIILQSCVNKYAPPAWTHFQNALYSALQKRQK